ncbi:MAG: CARDB domain-containing protein, partial [Flavobacteriales bacterium]
LPILIIPKTTDLQPFSGNLGAVNPNMVAGVSYSQPITVFNNGNLNSTSVTLGFYLSSDSIWDGGDWYASAATVPVINAGATSTVVINYSVQNTFTSGTYYLLIVVDNFNTYAEDVETNNIVHTVVNVLPMLPDIAYTSGNLNTTNIIYPGSTVSTSTAWKNNGISNTLATNIKLYFSADALADITDVLVSTNPLGVLSPGGTYSLTNASYSIPVATPPGTYYFILVADEAGVNSESNIINNTGFIPVTIQILNADLVSTGLFLENVAATNSGFNLHYYVTNTGTSPTNSSISRVYISKDTILDGSDLFAYNAQAAIFYPAGLVHQGCSPFVPSSLPAGLYYFLVQVDQNNSTSETNETNNVSWVQFSFIDDDTLYLPPGDSIHLSMCPDNYIIVDDGGLYNNYSPGLESTLFLETNQTNRISVAISNLITSGCCDTLFFFDGPSTQAPLLAAISDMTATTYVESSYQYITIQFSSLDTTGAAGYVMFANCISGNSKNLVHVSHSLTDTLYNGTNYPIEFSFKNTGGGFADPHVTEIYLSPDMFYDSNDELLKTYNLPGLAGYTCDSISDVLNLSTAMSGPAFVIILLDIDDDVSELSAYDNVLPIPVVVNPVVGLAESTLELKANVSPNPCNGKTTLFMHKLFSSVTLRITDISGKIISTGSYSYSNQIEITLPEPGCYVLEVANENSVKYFKIISE